MLLYGKVCCTSSGRRQGAYLPHLAYWVHSLVYHWVCDVRPASCPTCSHFRSCRTSPPFGWYQVIHIVDRGIITWRVALLKCRSWPSNLQHFHSKSDVLTPLDGWRNNNNSTTIFMVLLWWRSIIVSIHPVHLMNADWAPGGCQPSDQVTRLGLWVRR